MKAFFLDMKNLLSIGALGIFVFAVVTGLFDSDQTFSIIMMVFSFFLGSKINKV